MGIQITQAKRLTSKEAETVELIRAELIADGYTFVVEAEDYRVYRVDGEIGLGPCEESGSVSTLSDVFDLDDANVNYTY